jgi:hypothetical protein
MLDSALKVTEMSKERITRSECGGIVAMLPKDGTECSENGKCPKHKLFYSHKAEDALVCHACLAKTMQECCVIGNVFR